MKFAAPEPLQVCFRQMRRVASLCYVVGIQDAWSKDPTADMLPFGSSGPTAQISFDRKGRIEIVLTSIPPWPLLLVVDQLQGIADGSDSSKPAGRTAFPGFR